jgi:putative membrane protein insertion efficiency factor
VATRLSSLLARAAERLMLGLIRVYQLTLSPWLGRQCRYTPTCSVYAAEVIRRFGPWRGAWLALKRLGRCHPWGAAGYDPVPDS